jgi:CRISPR-associated protein Csd2
MHLRPERVTGSFRHDRSAARGQMSKRGLELFEHEGMLDNAHAHTLLHRLAVHRAGDAAAPARDFGACSVTFDDNPLAAGKPIDAAPGVTLTRRC